MRKDVQRAAVIAASVASSNAGEIDVEAFDAREMASWELEDPNLELEGRWGHTTLFTSKKTDRQTHKQANLAIHDLRLSKVRGFRKRVY